MVLKIAQGGGVDSSPHSLSSPLGTLTQDFGISARVGLTLRVCFWVTRVLVISVDPRAAL